MKSNTNLVLNHLLWRGLYFFSVLFLNIGIARFFAAEKSGQIFFIVNNLALVLLIVSISLESGLIHFIASGNLQAAQMARFCGLWSIAASLLAIAGWYVILYFTHSAYLSETGFLSASFLFILGVLLTTYFTALYYAKKDFVRPNKILFILNGLLLVLLIPGRNLPFFRNHFILIYFFFFFLQGIFLMISFFRNESQTGVSGIPPGHILKSVIQYSLSALLANGIYFLLNRIDYWFVQYFCSANDLGNYIQASKLAQMLFILPAMLTTTLFPIFSSRESSKNITQVASSMRILFFINCILCIGIAALGWYFIPLLFGSSFNHMYLLFVLLIPGVLCVTMNYPMTAWYAAGKRIGVNIRGSVLALVVLCAGDLLLLPRFGIQTAPVMSSAGFFCYYCYTMITFRKENPIPLKSFLFIRQSDISRILQTIRNREPDSIPENPIV